MRELYLNVSQHFRAGKLAEGLRRHSQKLRAVVVAMAMIFIAAPFYGQTWNLVDIADLTSTDVFMIVDTAGGYAMTNDNGTSNPPACVSLSFNADKSQVTTAPIPDNVKWNISGDDTDGYTFYPDGTTETWLYCTNANNGVRVGTNADNNSFTLYQNNWLLNGATNRYVGVYSGNDWRCYTSTTGNIASTRIAFYKYTANLNTVATPTFLPEAGTYNGTQDITISCATADATIRYTLDGTEPTETSTEYTTAIEVSTNTTIKAKAWKDGLTASGIATAEYVITNYTQLDAPTFSPVAGIYTGAQDITITAADGATIRYTLDGTDPTETSTEYTAAIRISSDKTIKAKAWMDGYLPSDVVSADYVIELPTVTFNKLASHTQITTSDVYMIVDVASGRALTSANGTSSAPTAVEVTIENNAITGAIPYALQWKFAEEEGGYSIYPAEDNDVLLYSTSSNNGVRVGTSENKVWEIDITDAGSSYHGMKNVAQARYIGVYQNQDWRTYTSIHDNIKNTQIEFFILGEAPESAPANPTFNPAEGTFFNNVDVALACETEGATIYYTLDGTDPTDASTPYTEAIHITETTTVKAIAIKNALSSEIVSATYTISNIETVATPVIAPEAGNYNEPQLITITCATDEASIYYTLDGTDPTEESTLYTEPFTLSASATVKAIAVKEGMNNSQIVSAAYTMPVFHENLAAVYSTAANDQYRVTGDVTFIFRNGRNIFVMDETAGMLIYDNATSVVTTEYQEGDVISGGISGKTSIYKGLYEIVPMANLAASTTNTGAIVPAVVTIRQMVNGNDYTSKLVTLQNMTITAINGASITISDGDTTTVIRDQFSVVDEANYAVGDVVTVTGLVSIYNTFQVYPRTAEDITMIAAPTFTPEADTYTTSVTVTLTCETDGATIYYNIEPNDAQLEYTEPLTFTETTTISAYAMKNGLRSAVVTAIYTITDMETVATPTITPDGGEFETTLDVTLACETADASIYYTLDGTDPTAESTLYSVPFTLDATTTVKAIAVKENMHASAIAEASFTKLEPVVPVNYTRITSLRQLQDGDKVIIAARYDDDATHYYVAPTTYRTVSGSNTKIYGTAVDAESTSEGYMITTDVDSIVWTVNIVEGSYTFTNASDNLIGWISGTNWSYTQNTLWNISECTAGASSYVPNYAGFKVSNSADETRAIALKSNDDHWFAPYSYGTNSNNGEYNFAIDLFVDISNHTPIVATPTITPNGGEFETTVDVTLACTTEDAAIYYTLNGETPTTESTPYVEPFTLAETTTVKVIAVKEGMDNSDVAEATFTKVVPTVATPTITPNGGNFEESVEVTLACETADAAIRYTTDGTDPTVESTLYEAPFTLTETKTVKAIAVKEGLANSEIAEATFTKVEPLVAVNYTRITSLSQLQDGDKVIIAARYDDNADHYYVAPTRIANNRFNGVAVTTENDIISTAVDTVVWTVMIADDMYKFVNASNDTLGYGTSGTAFISTSNKEWTVAEYTNVATALVAGYTGYKITNVENDGRSVALNAGNNNVFGAYANSNAENNNAAQYNFALDFFVDLSDHAPLVATPTFSVPAGNYSSEQTVEILCATEGATIHYTLDGTDPTEESSVYETALTITEPTTVKAKAYKQDCIASGIAEAFYNVNTTPTITVDAETLNFENVNETKTLNVSSLNLTENITVAVTENFTVDTETITMNTEATLTVTFVGNAVTNGTLTLTSGETEVTVALVATPLVASEGCYYPVAEAQTDWTGDYLITYTDLSAETINALNGIHSNNYGTYTNVFEYYADGLIASNMSTEVCKVTVEPTENGYYSMYLNRSGYLGINSDANKLYSYNTFSAERDEWTFSENNGEIVITSVKYPNRNLKWNSGDPRFACYKNTSSTGDPLTLYKLGAIPAVATPVFTPVAGYYEEAQNVTITCSTEGATIYYTIDGTAPTNESTQYTEPIAVSQNTTIKAIAYVGEEASFVATSRYTFPNFVENIAALYALENTTDTYVLTGDVTFVYRNGKNMYVKDETAGLLLFDRNEVVTTEYTEGDVISGGITGTISMYHGMLEFIPTFNTAVSTQNTGAVVPTVITVEQLRSNAYVSQLVKVENVNIAEGTTYAEGQTGSNVTFSQNGSEALLRNSFKTLDMEIGDNTNWDITGFAAIYDSDIQIFPRDNDDVTLVTSVEELTAEIAIYPNPTSNVINIAAEGLNVERVELANVDGQIVSSEEVASDMVTVSLEEQPAGMYFVRIYTANEVIVRKVTKF